MDCRRETDECSALTSSVAAEGLPSPCSPTAERSHTATSQRSAKTSSKNGFRTDAWKMLQSSRTFNPFLISPWPPAGSRLTTSSASRQGSRARTSVLQAARWVFLATQDHLCGERCSDLQRTSRPSSGSSSRTSLPSSPSEAKASAQSSLTYSKQAIVCDGQLYHAPSLVPVISVRGGGHCVTGNLPTPRTHDQHRPLTFITLNQRVCMSSCDGAIPTHNRVQQLGHLNCQLSESIMGYPLNWTQTTVAAAQ